MYGYGELLMTVDGDCENLLITNLDNVLLGISPKD